MNTLLIDRVTETVQADPNPATTEMLGGVALLTADTETAATTQDQDPDVVKEFRKIISQGARQEDEVIFGSSI